MSFDIAARALREIRTGTKTFSDLDEMSRAALTAEILAIMVALRRPGDTMEDAAARFSSIPHDWPEIAERMWQSLIDAAKGRQLH